MLFMKGEWGRLNRVQLGTGPPRSWKPVLEWCEENLHGNYFHSEAYECFYFKNVKDALFFKLRWFDECSSNRKTH